MPQMMAFVSLWNSCFSSFWTTFFAGSGSEVLAFRVGRGDCCGGFILMLKKNNNNKTHKRNWSCLYLFISIYFWIHWYWLPWLSILIVQIIKKKKKDIYIHIKNIYHTLTVYIFSSFTYQEKILIQYPFNMENRHKI